MIERGDYNDKMEEEEKMDIFVTLSSTLSLSESRLSVLALPCGKLHRV